jgi:phage terminase Nu1 subunit (DNA packaging protein)
MRAKQPTQADIARRHGVTKTAVGKRIKAGATLAEVDAALASSTRLDLAAPEVRDALNAERLRLTKAQADKAEMELAVRRGELVEAARVLAARDTSDAILFSVLDGKISETCARMAGLPGDVQEAHWRKVIQEVKDLARQRYEELLK